MHNTIKLIIVKFFVVFIIAGCSTTALQSTRLNKAETYLIQAEQALVTNRISLAKNNIGTAKAYLDTLKDNLKFLTKAEVKLYHKLRVKEKATAAKIGFKFI